MNIQILGLGVILFFGVTMFLQIRKQNKAVKEHAATLATLMPGDRVMLSSGLYGTIVAIDDETVDLEIAEEVVVVYKKGAIVELLKDDAADDETETDVASDDPASPTEH